MKWHSVHKRLSSKHQVAYWIIKMNIGLSKLQKVTDLVSLSGIVKEGQQKNLCIKKKKQMLQTLPWQAERFKTGGRNCLGYENILYSSY